MLLVWTWSICRLSGKGDVCEELRKRMIDVSCLQEVRLRRQGARMQGMEGDISCDGEEKEMEEQCEKVVEIRMVSDIVMAVF